MRTERLDKGKARVYLRKAQDFASGLRRSADREEWNSVGLLSVHLVISTADALTTFYLGERSRSQDHGDAAQLLRRIPVTGIEEHADKALEVIRVKNVVEYEAREFEETEATATMKKALRFHEWGRQQLGER